MPTTLKWLLLMISSSLAIASGDQRCGEEFSCWHHPELHLLISFRPQQDVIQFNLTRSNVLTGMSSYAALGLSSDEWMGNDEVMACLVNSNGDAKFQYSRNSEERRNIPELGEHISDVTVVYDSANAVLSCAFARPVKVPEKGFFDLGDKSGLFLLSAVGSVRSFESGELNKHSQSRVSEKRVDLTVPTNIADDESPGLLIVGHGVLQTAAWGIALPISVFTVHFYRPYFTLPVQGRKPKWFVIHAVANVATFVLCVAGIASAVTYMNFELEASVHTVSGFVLFIVLVLQLLMGLLRPAEESRWRQVFVWSHRLVGFLLLVASQVVVFTGIHEFREEYSSESYTHFFFVILVVVMVAFFLFVVAFSKRLDDATDRAQRYVVDTSAMTNDHIADDIKKSYKQGVMIKIHYAFCVSLLLLAIIVMLDLMFQFSSLNL